MFEKRKSDWRNQQIVYQIFVDRFARSDDFSKKKGLYAAPRKLKRWNQQPKPGKFASQAGCWSHELEFWGGDLQGVIQKIPYLQQLGINTIYLNPIFRAYSNHKYDAIDYFAIDSQFGSQKDLETLAKEAHRVNIRIVLDGVFNHVSPRSHWFLKATASKENHYRNFFYFDKKYPHGYRAWNNVKNLPELNLENPEVQEKIFANPDSVVQSYLKIVDGWRLDVAFDLGSDILRQLTTAAHKARKGSLVTGEIWNYPGKWLKVMDAIMNFHMSQIIIELVNGGISPNKAGQWIQHMVDDCGIEPLLKSWIVLSNHDTPRLKVVVPDSTARMLALVLQFTLPGSPLIYYGEELGQNGDKDPKNRGPMQWSMLKNDNETAKFYRELIKMRNSHPALQYGDFYCLLAEKSLVFCRTAQKIKDMVIVAINPSGEKIVEKVQAPDYRLMHWGKLQSWDSDEKASVYCGIILLSLPPQSYRIFTPITDEQNGYTPYKRVR